MGRPVPMPKEEASEVLDNETKLLTPEIKELVFKYTKAIRAQFEKICGQIEKATTKEQLMQAFGDLSEEEHKEADEAFQSIEEWEKELFELLDKL